MALVSRPRIALGHIMTDKDPIAAPVLDDSRRRLDARAERLLHSPVKGTNQVDVRGFNEKLILHLIRHYGQLTKAEATRATGLSPNAISTICRAL